MTYFEYYIENNLLYKMADSKLWENMRKSMFDFEIVSNTQILAEFNVSFLKSQKSQQDFLVILTCRKFEIKH